MNGLHIGLMSGTSLDGVDGVLVAFAPPSPPLELQVLAHAHQPFGAGLATELLALNSAGDNELQRAALAGNALALVYAEVVATLLRKAGVPAAKVMAIGAHGQTVRHRPGAFDGIGFTLQLGNPALLAELTAIDVVADFRSRDVAAGGQGAPLVPAFHRAVFGRSGQAAGVLNIGGIGNLTVLAADGSTIGFDCGPGNALMDHWCRVHTGKPFDEGGRWAAGGVIVDALLHAMFAEPFFALSPPKSTGRDLFHPAWLTAHLDAPAVAATAPRPVDVQATLTELTARVAAEAVRVHGRDIRELLVCGGGAFNQELLRRLGVHLPGVAVLTTQERGLPPEQVEACAFAWLAREHRARRSGNLAAVTGARGPRVLGALYPGA
jgi:anhydro-N-acetylmuramic acid kinase